MVTATTWKKVAWKAQVIVLSCYRAGNSGLAVQGTLCPVAQLFEGTFKFLRGRHFALLPEFFRALSKFWGAVIYTSI